MKTKVQIIAKDHPHFEEYGNIISSEEGTVTVYRIFGKEKIKVELINCPHLIKETFVGRNEIKLIE